MSDFGVVAIGLDQFAQRIKNLSVKELKSISRKSVRAATTFTKNKAAQYAPIGDREHYVRPSVRSRIKNKSTERILVLPGNLKRGIRAKARRSRSTRNIIFSVGYDELAYYGIFFDRGTRYIPKREIIDKVRQDNADQITQVFFDKFDKLIEDLFKK